MIEFQLIKTPETSFLRSLHVEWVGLLECILTVWYVWVYADLMSRLQLYLIIRDIVRLYIYIYIVCVCIVLFVDQQFKGIWYRHININMINGSLEMANLYMEFSELNIFTYIARFFTVCDDSIWISLKTLGLIK